MPSTLIIAECGVNHQGDFEDAKLLARTAKQAGADIAKFQLFKGRTEIEHLRLSEAQMEKLAEFCEAIGIEFACTPFYPEAVKFLDPMVKRHKIASSWVHSPEIAEAALETGKQVIISMGMADDRSLMEYQGRKNVSILHCVSKYPTPDEEARLRSLYSAWYDGYSDHTVGTTACLGAVALGAKIIEKHLTLDKYQSGPDHACSAEPQEFANMVRDIRRLEKML